MKLAYRTTWGGISGIVAAHSRAAAGAITMRCVREAFNGNETWKGLRVIRAPEFDGWAEQDQSGTVWDEKHLKGNQQ